MSFSDIHRKLWKLLGCPTWTSYLKIVKALVEVVDPKHVLYKFLVLLQEVMESSTDEVDGSTPLATLTCENASCMTLQSAIPKSQLIDCIKSYQKDLGPILEEAELSLLRPIFKDQDHTSTSSTIATGIQRPAKTYCYMASGSSSGSLVTTAGLPNSPESFGSISSIISMDEGTGMKDKFYVLTKINEMFRNFIIAAGGRVLHGGSTIFGTSPVPVQEVLGVADGSFGDEMESSLSPCADHYGSGFARGETASNFAEDGEEPAPKKKRSQESVSKKRFEVTMEKFFKKHPCTPISSICKTQQWLGETDLRWVRDNDRRFQTVCDVLSNEFITFTLRQFAEMYQKPGCTPLFALPRGMNALVTKDDSGNDLVTPYYLTVDESVEICSKLLDFQTDGQTAMFLKTLVDVLDKRIPKLNTMFVYGPPSSGKNFFFDAVLNFFLVRGQMMNIRKGEGFPYMDCVDRRVILFNEPNICESPATMDTLKMLFGGDFCAVAVKFRAPSVIHRTPIFVLTNDSMLFKNVPAFNDRMVRYTWKQAPFLKDVKGYPNPLFLINLLNKYNISF